MRDVNALRIAFLNLASIGYVASGNVRFFWVVCISRSSRSAYVLPYPGIIKMQWLMWCSGILVSIKVYRYRVWGKEGRVIIGQCDK